MSKQTELRPKYNTGASFASRRRAAGPHAMEFSLMRPILNLRNGLLIASALFVSGGLMLNPQDGAESAGQFDEESETVVMERATVEMLLDEIELQRRAIADLREQLGQAQLRAVEAERERNELRQFLQDNREYGEDFEQYQEIREIREREARQREAERLHQQREAIQAQRDRERAQRAAEAQSRRAEENRLDAYREAGFSPLGLDVFIGRMGYFYGTQNSSIQVEYEPIVGFFYQPVNAGRIDYSKMNISGSVLNASDEVRNLGVAIAFFDARGNQVGSQTVQINNARPNVPYPFNATVDMASAGAFASSSQWVLYADPVEGGEEE